jgi:hypothetical protein
VKRYFIFLTILLALPCSTLAGTADDWNALNTAVRDGTIGRSEARARLSVLREKLRAEFGRVGGKERVFPVAGYGPAWGEEGKGYRPVGYDFYDGNRHGGHPAHDLFICDRDQDSRDDRSGREVPVVAFSAGVVVATATEWTPGSDLRGGIYIWIYDPASDRFCYYAHLGRADVRPGQTVRAGEPLGVLGRSGKNAWAKRSPTHLHFMVLAWEGGRMTPVDPWLELLGAAVAPTEKTRPASETGAGRN